MDQPVFAYHEVDVVRGTTRILDSVTLTVPGTGVTVVVGPSGSGKSTLLRLANRLESPTDGRVTYRGVDLTSIDPLAHRRRVAMVFQAPTAFPGTVADNVRVADPGLGTEGVDALMDRVGLDRAFSKREAATLSGGEAQRMVVARALATEPEVLLADEPTSALDPTATETLEALARSLAEDGLPVLWVTHDMAQVDRLADHVVVLDRGRVIWSAGAADSDRSAVMAEVFASTAPGPPPPADAPAVDPEIEPVEPVGLIETDSDQTVDPGRLAP